MSEAMVPRQSGGQMKPVDRLKGVLATASVQEQFRNALGDASPLFAASVLDLASSSPELMQCEPAALVREALKAAVLRLPLARGLGYAYVVPRRDHGEWKPQMQIGWRGWVQLAQRTGLYRSINAGEVYVGEFVRENRISGEVDIVGQRAGDEVIGYFAFFRLVNGFEKTIYWPIAQLQAHRDRYVPGWNRKGSAWQTHPHEMAAKTLLSSLLRRFGPTSVEMQRALVDDEPEPQPDRGRPNAETVDFASSPEPPPAAKGKRRPPAKQDGPEAPAWLAILREREDDYLGKHQGVYPDGYPREVQDEATASRWIAWFDAQQDVEPEIEEPGF
ncbi:MAG: recombinase [Deltaproteobacteria bacterium]|nr:recombinase [Deltaproteobacteria bacterium]